MTIYERLQDLCNRQIEKGRRPRNTSYQYGTCTQHIVCNEDGVDLETSPESEYFIEFSYHDLFSANSGFMESFEWNSIGAGLHFLDCNAIGYDMCIDEEVRYHYMMMGPLKSEEKIKYVLENVVMPE